MPALPVKGSNDWYSWAQGVDVSARAVVNVKQYGAVGDGTTDDTAAIKAALTAAQAASKPLYLSAGSYRITSPLGAVDVRKTPIRGDGPQATRIVATGLAQGTSVLSVGWDATTGSPWNGQGTAISGVTFIGDTTATAANGVQIAGTGTNPQANGLHFTDVVFSGFGTQVSAGTMSYLISFHRCRFDAAVTRGFSIDQATTAGENFSFVSCIFANSPGTLAYIDQSGGEFYFFGCSFDYSARALHLRSGHASFMNCHFEADSTFSATATEYLLVNRRGSVTLPILTITDCEFFAVWDSYQTAVRLTGDTYGGNALRMFGLYVKTTPTMTQYLVRDDGPTPSDILVDGHWFTDDRYVPSIRDNAGGTYRLSLGAPFRNRPARSVRRIAATAVEPYPMIQASAANNVDSSTLWATMFCPTEDITLTGVTFWTGPTAQAGATLIRLGLYDWDTTQANLRASTVNDTTLASAANTRYTKSFSTPYTCKAGGVYALTILVVGATTAPVLACSDNSNDWLLSDRTTGHPISWRYVSQTDLPSVVYSGSQWSSQKPFYLVGNGS